MEKRERIMPTLLTGPGRPCIVMFETRPIEDREASEREGYYVAKDVVFAVVMAPGGQDTVEKIASEWVDEKTKKADPHAELYKRAYTAYLEGHEIPENGMFIKSWPPISPAMADQCIRANIRTVEDLATAPDDSLRRIGIGSVALQQKAETWLNTAMNVGTASEKIANLSVRVGDLEQENDRKDEIIEKLKMEVQVNMEVMNKVSSAPDPEPEKKRSFMGRNTKSPKSGKDS
jgi:hypothetical protein